MSTIISYSTLCGNQVDIWPYIPIASPQCCQAGTMWYSYLDTRGLQSDNSHDVVFFTMGPSEKEQTISALECSGENTTSYCI